MMQPSTTKKVGWIKGIVLQVKAPHPVRYLGEPRFMVLFQAAAIQGPPEWAEISW